MFSIPVIGRKNRILGNVLTNLAPPVISGDTGIGDLLTVSQGLWSGTDPITYSYQWLRNGLVIPGEDSTTYTTVLADDGNNISCRETAMDAGGFTGDQTSNQILISDVPVCTCDSTTSGNTLSFTGAAEWAEINAGNPFAGTSEWSISFTYYPRITRNMFISEWNGGGTYLQMEFSDLSNFSIFDSAFGSKGAGLSPAIPSLNQQYDVVIQRTSTNLKVYIDGTIRHDSAFSDNITNTGFPIEIGSANSGGAPQANCDISNFAIFDRSLTLSEVQALRGSGGDVPQLDNDTCITFDDAYILAIPFNSVKASPLNDVSGNGLNATLNGVGLEIDGEQITYCNGA